MPEPARVYGSIEIVAGHGYTPNARVYTFSSSGDHQRWTSACAGIRESAAINGASKESGLLDIQAIRSLYGLWLAQCEAFSNKWGFGLVPPDIRDAINDA